MHWLDRIADKDLWRETGLAKKKTMELDMEIEARNDGIAKQELH